VKQLEENVEIARAFTPMPAAEMAKLEAVTSTIVPDALWLGSAAAGIGKRRGRTAYGLTADLA
jgi:hypothetical protein